MDNNKTEKINSKLKGLSLINKVHRHFRAIQKRALAIAEFKDAQNKQHFICEGSPEAFQDMPLHVQWEITQYCNYNCSYCFQAADGHKNNYCSLEQAKKVIEHIASSNRSSYQIYLLGGEPLSHPNIIEIVKLLDKYLGEKIEVVRFLTNGSFKPGQFEALTEAANHFTLLLSISVHFEFNKPERIIRFVKEYANKTSLELGLMFHPEYFDALKETVAELTELRKEYPFHLLINKIHEPPNFNQLDSRYTDEHFEWAEEAMRDFRLAESVGPKVRHDRSTEFGRNSFFTEEKTASGIERKKYGSYEELDEATNRDFSGMFCCAGTMVLTVYANGRAKGTRCPVTPTICNIYEENPFVRDDWMFAHPCTSTWCGDVSNRRIAKFKSKRDAEKYLTECKKKQKDIIRPSLPKTIRIDASTACQLRCAGCYFQNNEGRELGLGHLSLEDFAGFINKNPQISRVELSNYGEIFLNPQLIDIMAYAHKKGVELTASMGVNFNTVSEEQMKALVDYEFRFISLSIDGASQDTYSKYRIGGDFNRVIDNIKKLQELKKSRGSVYPELQWQFVPNEYNENEVLQAKAMASELGIPIVFKLNFLKSYTPKDSECLKAETGLAEVTRQEYLRKHELPYLNDDCLQVFNDPQFNYDGTLLGCSRNESRFFKSNLFRDGIENCLNDKDYLRMKEFLLSKNPDYKRYKGIPCLNCDIWKSRNAYKKSLILHD